MKRRTIQRTQFPLMFSVNQCLVLPSWCRKFWRVILPDGDTYAARDTFRAAVRAARSVPSSLNR